MSHGTASGGLTATGLLIGAIGGFGAVVGIYFGVGALSANSDSVTAPTATIGGIGQIGGTIPANADAGANLTTSGTTVFAYDLFGYSIGSAPVARNSSGTITQGTDCTTLSTCGTTGDKQCCSGWTRRSFNAASTCGTTFGVARGSNQTTGPQWVEQNSAATHASVVDAYGTTRIASGSNGASLPQSTINVVDTTVGFAASTTTLRVTSSNGVQILACTGKTSTTFTGCTGGSGTLSINGRVEDDSVRPLGLQALGNALAIAADTNDQARIAIQIGTQSTDPACATAGLCDSTSDVNGDPMLQGTYYVRMITWATATATTSNFGSCHMHQGVNFGTTCTAGNQDKENEREQVFGDNNLLTQFVLARTCGVAACPNGSSSASTFKASTTVNTTGHVLVIKVENDINASCTTPDDNSTAVSCAAGNHERLTLRIDQADESGAASKGPVVVENWGNSHRLNALECSGTHAFRIEGLCYATTYADALSCNLP